MVAQRNTEYDDVSTVAQAVVKVVALVALVLILLIDSNNPTMDAKDIQLILAGFVAGAEALTVYRKASNKKE